MKAGEEGKEIKEFHKEGTEHDRMKTEKKWQRRKQRTEGWTGESGVKVKQEMYFHHANVRIRQKNERSSTGGLEGESETGNSIRLGQKNGTDPSK